MGSIEILSMHVIKYFCRVCISCKDAEWNLNEVLCFIGEKKEVFYSPTAAPLALQPSPPSSSPPAPTTVLRPQLHWVGTAPSVGSHLPALLHPHLCRAKSINRKPAVSIRTITPDLWPHVGVDTNKGQAAKMKPNLLRSPCPCSVGRRRTMCGWELLSTRLIAVKVGEQLSKMRS